MLHWLELWVIIPLRSALSPYRLFDCLFLFLSLSRSVWYYFSLSSVSRWYSSPPHQTYQLNPVGCLHIHLSLVFVIFVLKWCCRCVVAVCSTNLQLCERVLYFCIVASLFVYLFGVDTSCFGLVWKSVFLSMFSVLFIIYRLLLNLISLPLSYLQTSECQVLSAALYR